MECYRIKVLRTNVKHRDVTFRIQVLFYNLQYKKTICCSIWGKGKNNSILGFTEYRGFAYFNLIESNI